MDAHDAVDRWERDGLLTSELADRLRDSLDEDERADRSQTVIALFVGLGAILIGGGLLLFIASQWDSQSPVRRVGLLVAVYAVVVAAAAVAERQRLATTARGLWFLSSIAVGVNIFLLGQIFNLPLNYWQGTLLWAVAALAMGWASPSSLHGWLVVVLGLLTLAWLSVPSSLFFDQAAFLWDAAGIRALLPLVGLALAAGSTLVPDTDVAYLERPARATGVLLLAAPVTVSTFHPTLYAAIWEIDWRWGFHLAVVAVSLVVVALVWIRRPHPLLAWSAPALAIVMLVLLVQHDPGPGAPDTVDDFGSTSWLAGPFGDSELLFGLYDAAVFALALGVIVVGRRLRIAALVNVGTAVVAVLTMAIYIGRFAGALPTSIAVLIGGLLLVAAAVVLERKRRDLVAEVAT